MKINEDALGKAGFEDVAEALNCDVSSLGKEVIFCVPQNIMATKPLSPPNSL